MCNNGILILSQLIAYVRRTGLIETYNMYLSNPQYLLSLDEIVSTVSAQLDTWKYRFNKVFQPKVDGELNEIDYRLLKDLYTLVDWKPWITHYVIISGDKDFYPGITFLEYRRKHVVVLSADQVTSKFLKKYQIN